MNDSPTDGDLFGAETTNRGDGERLSYLELHQRLLEEYASPSVVVNEEYEVVHCSARAGRYMQIPAGEPSHNLLKMIRPELRLQLRAALYQALRDGTIVETSGLEVRANGQSELVNIIVRPVLHEDDRAHGFFLVLFEEAEKALKQKATGIESVVGHDQTLAEANTALGEAIRAREQAIWRLVTAQEDERRKIARDLHDQLGQQLTALRLHLEALKAQLLGDERGVAQIEQIQVITRRIESDIDFLAWDLRPLALDDLGLQAALNDYVHRWSKHSDIQVDFHSQGLGRRLLPEVETNLYRIAQEALNNVFKHARATRADVILDRRDHYVVLIIEDNGSGFDHNTRLNTTDGIGLIGMRERVNLIGGTLEIESVPRKGTTVFVRVPTEEAVAENR